MLCRLSASTIRLAGANNPETPKVVVIHKPDSTSNKKTAVSPGSMFNRIFSTPEDIITTRETAQFEFDDLPDLTDVQLPPATSPSAIVLDRASSLGSGGDSIDEDNPMLRPSRYELTDN